MIVVLWLLIILKHKFGDFVLYIAKLQQKVLRHKVEETVLTKAYSAYLKGLQIGSKSSLRTLQPFFQEIGTNLCQREAITPKPRIFHSRICDRSRVSPRLCQFCGEVFKIECAPRIKSHTFCFVI